MQDKQMLAMADELGQAQPEVVLAGGKALGLDAPDAVWRAWQPTVHRVAAGQRLWLDVSAGQWLQVHAGALRLTQGAGLDLAQLDARWAMSWPDERGLPLVTHLGHGEVMAVCERTRSRVQFESADGGDVVFVLWQASGWRQRWARGFRQLGKRLSGRDALPKPDSLVATSQSAGRGDACNNPPAASV